MLHQLVTDHPFLVDFLVVAVVIAALGGIEWLGQR